MATTGSNVAAYVQITGLGITSTSGAPLDHVTREVFNGQGNGAIEHIGTPDITFFPVAQYALRLGLEGTSTTQLTASLCDCQNNPVSGAPELPVWKSYGSAITARWYNPSPQNPEAPSPPYTNGVASVDDSGNVTALAVGECVIEAQFPWIGNPFGDDQSTGNPAAMIFAQVIVTVLAQYTE